MGGVTTTDTGETLNSLNWVDMDEVIHAFHTLSPDQMTWACAKGERSAPLHALVFGPNQARGVGTWHHCRGYRIRDVARSSERDLAPEK